MPVSLAVGSVKTPAFLVVHEWYDILVRVRNHPATAKRMWCMLGVTEGPLEAVSCLPNEPLLRAQWTVRDETGSVVAQGVSTKEADAAFSTAYIFKFVGGFMGAANTNYTVEVHFTADGTPLNASDPHLIVIRHQYQ